MKKILAILIFSVLSLFAYEEINSENFTSKTSSDKVIVKFHATWCVNCAELERNFNEVDLKKLGVSLYKVNIEEQMALTAKYKIRALPTILYLKNGKLISTEMGVKSPQDLIESINQTFY